MVLVFFFAAFGYLSSSAQSLTQAPMRPASVNPPSTRQETQDRSAVRNALTPNTRQAFISKAQVWKRTEVPNMDLRAGPGGPGAFRPNEKVTCTLADVPKHGATRKFHCALPNGDVVKVRYGATNGEVEGSVLATRLLWALGFEADRVYPVEVTCRGCSSDPWTARGNRHDVHEFDPAVIERKPLGHEMWEDNDKQSGWSWSELNLVDASFGGAPREQRDALKLLAVFMQHTDNKAEQQRLLCLPGGFAAGECTKPFLMLHDVGMTFGHANMTNKDSRGSVNFETWTQTPIWKDPAACIAHLSKSRTGTLSDPRISEAGRKFLADLLVQLSDRQLHDLFEVARVDRRLGSNVTAAPVENWVAAFKSKRNEIVTNHCGS
jgi:hypothetical protein